MRKLLALAFLALSVANANAQYLNVSPSGGGGTPGGSDLQVQYNNAGAFGGLSTLTWDGAKFSLSAQIVDSTNGAASTPPILLNGTWFTGGTATTTKPHFLIEPTGTTSTGWSTAGTGLGINAPAGFTGRILDVQRNGVSEMYVEAGTGIQVSASVFAAGSVYSTGGSFIVISGDVALTSNNGKISLGATSDLLLSRHAAASLQFGAADSAAPVAQTIGAQSVVAGTTDTAGANWTLNGSTSTGAGLPGDIILRTGGTGAGATAQNAFVTALTIKGATQQVIAANSVQTTCTTVTGLGAAGTAGRNWCVTDQLTACPALGGTFTGGGAVVCKAFDDGTNWTHQ